MNEEVIQKLKELEEKHNRLKLKIEEAIKSTESAPNQVGKIMTLMVTYRTGLDLIKQEAAETMKMIPDINKIVSNEQSNLF